MNKVLDLNGLTHYDTKLKEYIEKTKEDNLSIIQKRLDSVVNTGESEVSQRLKSIVYGSEVQ